LQLQNRRVVGRRLQQVRTGAFRRGQISNIHEF
jgi:hypothetical protein